MREFDNNGIRLAEFQGKIFEQSVDLDCSSAVFLRRFFHSDYLIDMDRNASSDLSLCTVDAFSSIERQFGKTEYGKKKESKESMFWLGYLYRYVSYTRNVTTRFVMKVFNYKEILPLYYTYHTQDMEWCVRSILEKYGLPTGYFDPNFRLKCVVREKMHN